MSKVTIEVEIPPEIDQILQASAERLGRDLGKHRRDYVARLFGQLLKRFTEDSTLLRIFDKHGWDVSKVLADQLPSILQQNADLFIADIRRWEALLEAVAKYRAGELTQGQAAALAGLSRAEFLDVLSQAEVSPFQYENAEELREEVFRA